MAARLWTLKIDFLAVDGKEMETVRHLLIQHYLDSE